MIASTVRRTVDCHLHPGSLDDIPNLVRIAGGARFDRVNIVCVSGLGANERAFVAKAEHPDLFYFFGGLDHTARISGGRVETPTLAEQADGFAAMGADGVKMLETDDTFRESDDYGVLRGLALPDDILQKVYRLNFERLAGARPKRLDRGLARAECERVAQEMQALSGLEGLAPRVAERAGPVAGHARKAAVILG